MRINVAVPEAHVSRPVIDAALEATTRLNESLLRSGAVPRFRDAVNRVRWKPEPPGDEHFDHAAVVLGRGWGDCDDLAPWHAASLRTSGEDPGAKAFVKKSGPTRWHAVVRRSDGRVDDPSREAGMGQTNGVVGAVQPPMMLPRTSVVGGSYMLRPHLAMRPVIDRSGEIEAWQSRADLPWHWVPGRSPSDVAMVSLHASPVSNQSIVGAINGLLDIGEANGVDPDILERAEAIRDMCEGADWDEVADEYGEEHADAAGQLVGSFFGSITKGLGNIAKSVTNPKKLAELANPYNLVKHIPGVGPMASQFMPTTESLLKYGPQAAAMFPPTAALAPAFQMASPMLQKMLLEQGHVPPSQAPAMPPGYGAPQMPPGYGMPQMPYGYGGGVRFG